MIHNHEVGGSTPPLATVKESLSEMEGFFVPELSKQT